MIRNNLRPHRFYRPQSAIPKTSRLPRVFASAAPKNPTGKIRQLINDVKMQRTRVENQLVRLYNAGHMGLDFSSVIGSGLVITHDQKLAPWDSSEANENPKGGVEMIAAFKWRHKTQGPTHAMINKALRSSARALMSASGIFELYAGPKGHVRWESAMTEFVLNALAKEVQALRDIEEKLLPIGTSAYRRARANAKPTSSAQAGANGA